MKIFRSSEQEQIDKEYILDRKITITLDMACLEKLNKLGDLLISIQTEGPELINILKGCKNHCKTFGIRQDAAEYMYTAIDTINSNIDAFLAVTGR